MKAVCVLGNGQLGRMLRQAGEPLGISVFPVGCSTSPAILPMQDAVITAEIEQWPKTPLTRQLEIHPNFVNRHIFSVIADRRSQKDLLDELSLATAPWCVLSKADDLEKAVAKLGTNIVIKKRKGGYDGHGQYRLCHGQGDNLPTDVYNNAIAEAYIPFSNEVSLIGARNAAGHCVFYPLTHNYHEQGILKISIAGLPYFRKYQDMAERMLAKLMDHLRYVGVMAMECFVVEDKLLINELAPRVHNSGHWTQNGASISQFELHLRAILDLPVIKPEVTQTSVMINLLGIEKNREWLSLPYVHLHWYEKTQRENRKMGHLNVCPPCRDQLGSILTKCTPFLPASYSDALNWAKTNVHNTCK